MIIFEQLNKNCKSGTIRFAVFDMGMLFKDSAGKAW